MTEHATDAKPIVGLIMGSQSDWPTMKHAAEVLERFGVRYEAKVVSAHRTPDWMSQYAKTAASRGLKLIVAGAGGAAHLPGMVSALTPLPVLGVPVQSRVLGGLDSLLSIAQMPGGVPTATFAIGESGAKNAALFAVRMLALHDPALAEQLDRFIGDQRDRVLAGELNTDA